MQIKPISKTQMGTLLSPILVLSVLQGTETFAAENESHSPRSASTREVGCRYVLYPEVHRCVAGSGAMVLGDKTINLVLEDGLGENTAVKAQGIFEERGLTVTKAEQDASVDDIDVLIGIDNDKGADYEYLNGKFDPTVSVKRNDGYALKTSATDGIIAIMGADNSGAFYGVTTLDQILEQPGGVLTDTLIEDYADVKFRGFIEGFYGAPWSHANRKDLMSFGGDFKMNSYLYGPKDDPYHAARWRDPYPPEKLAELKELVDKGLETNVDFVWAAHVGGKIDLGSEADIQALKNKFDQMYGIGVRQYAIFFDDSATSNDQLVNFITRIDSEYIKPKGDVKPIMFCPQYYRKDSGSAATINYLKNISRFPKDVQIMWTGDNVVSPVKQSVVDWVTQYIDRPVYMWWNYPVNDLGRADYVHMGPSKGLYSGVRNMSGFASNPMNQAQASKVSLFSVADYTWNTDDYDYGQSWKDSFDHVIRDNPGAANALRIFSRNASNGLNPFDAGESLYLLPQMNAFKQAFANGDDISESGAFLVQGFEEIIGAVDRLKEYQGTNGISAELKPWLDKMRKIAQASRNTVQGLMELGEISADDPASIYTGMTLLPERREELGKAVSAPKVVAQKEIAPFTKASLNLLEMRLMETISTNMDRLVERFEEEGDLTTHDAAVSLQALLAEVHRLEEQGELQEAVERMEEFKLLLEGQRNEGLTSERAYRILNVGADYLIRKWLTNLAPGATIVASSEFNSNYGASKAADGIIGVSGSGEWASKGEQNPWIQLNWTGSQTINNVTFYDRPNLADWAPGGTLTFSDGSELTVSGIPNDGTAHSVTFPSKTVTWVKFQVEDGSGPNAGLSEIEVLGTRR